MRWGILALGFMLVLSAGLCAQVYRNPITGQDRIQGKIQVLDKAKSTMSLQQIATLANPDPEGLLQVVYDEETSVTLMGKPAKIDDLKKGLRVIVVGKSEKDVLKASQIDMRTEK